MKQKAAEALGNMVREALKRRRDAVVCEIARRFVEAFENVDAGLGTTDKNVEWIRIASLSQLRTVVGGRFRNLKEKWLEAGLPLREHRGDRKETACIKPEGWMSLSEWMKRQGYEARLAPGDENWLFEVRPLTENHTQQ